MRQPYFLGIDIGTQGARVVLMDAAGEILAQGEEHFPLSDRSREEQSPAHWWAALVASVRKMLAASEDKIETGSIRAVAVTSTSGTVIPLDEAFRPLHDALMYSDKRSAGVAGLCTAAALEHHPGGYMHFNASSGLSKMVWFVKQYPDKAKKICRWIHAADFITGKLSGNFDVTDYTNALKSGYDVRGLRWPSYLYEVLPLKKEWLQQVVPSGHLVGMMTPAAKAELGLSGDIRVMAGMTDGCASQIASGAVGAGEWNTTIGTTLVVKGVTRDEIADPLGRLYSHRHPDQGTVEGCGWMPGGASNTGADWIAGEYAGELDTLNQKALELAPTGELAWPLVQKGERFPFIAPEAMGFQPQGLGKAGRYTANLEGVAYIERLAYDMIRELSGERIEAVYTAGGGSGSDAWLIIRSNVLNLPLYKMKYVTGAVGAAILAASRSHFSSVTEAVKQMTQVEKIVRPDAGLAARYEPLYHQFVSLLKTKGYLPA